MGWESILSLQHASFHFTESYKEEYIIITNEKSQTIIQT